MTCNAAELCSAEWSHCTASCKDQVGAEHLGPIDTRLLRVEEIKEAVREATKDCKAPRNFFEKMEMS